LLVLFAFSFLFATLSCLLICLSNTHTMLNRNGQGGWGPHRTLRHFFFFPCFCNVFPFDHCQKVSIRARFSPPNHGTASVFLQTLGAPYAFPHLVAFPIFKASVLSPPTAATSLSIAGKNSTPPTDRASDDRPLAQLPHFPSRVRGYPSSFFHCYSSPSAAACHISIFQCWTF